MARLCSYSFLLLSIFSTPLLVAQELVLTGRVTDPQGNALPAAAIVLENHGHVVGQTLSGSDGQFHLKVHSPGQFTVKVSVSGFRPAIIALNVRPGGNSPIEVRMGALSSRMENVTVTADVNESDVLSPDPAEKVFVRQDLEKLHPRRHGPSSICWVRFRSFRFGYRCEVNLNTLARNH